MSGGENDGPKSGRSLPAKAPAPPATPLIAPTGSPGLNTVLDVINATVAPFTHAPPAAQGDAGWVAQGLTGVLGVVGAPAKIIDTAFAALTAPLAAMAPALPAMTMGGLHIGTPHTHTHPPSFIPPAPPVPLPSIGTIMGSCAMTVLIGGLPAARAGDIGIAVTCGSLAPPFNVYTGSSSVFIGGARAARIGDLTQHCNPQGGAAMSAFAVAMSAASIAAGAAGAAAGNSWAGAQAAADAAVLAMRLLCGKDPGLPPCVGALLGPPVPNVLIGGFPCPPIGEMAVGALLKGLKKAAAALKKFASSRANGHCGSASEPIYVVTGENFNAFTDFVSGGLFEWRRHYTSARCRSDGPLGHGFRHFYQRTLRLRLHRAVFSDWDGVTIEFPRFELGSDTTCSDGYSLTRLARGHFRLTTRGQPAMEFVGSEFGVELRLSKLSDGQREIVFEYEPQGRLRAATERAASGGQDRHFLWQYDEQGHLACLLESAPRGALDPKPTVRAFYRYDAQSNLSQVEDALGGTWAYEYDAFHRWKQQTDPRGYRYTWRYDVHGRCIEASGQDGLWRAELEYFPERRITRLTQGDQAIWEYHYDSGGFITKIVDPYGGEKIRERDAEGKVVAEIDSGGRELRMLHDQDGAPFARVDRFGNLFPPELEATRLSNPFKRRLPDSARGRFYEGFEPTSRRVAFSADGGPLASIPFELQYQARLSFHPRAPSVSEPAREERDALGRKTREIDALGRSREWRHDQTGNVVAMRDRDGKWLTQQTTSWNLIGERRSPLGHAMTFTHSSLEQVTSVTDPLGNVTRYEYDRKERLVRVHRGNELKHEYVYDRGDHFIEKRDGAGTLVFSNETHKNHFVKTRRLASGGVHQFEYDARGRITEASTAEHCVRLAYDSQGLRVLDIRDGLGIERSGMGERLRQVVLKRFVSSTGRSGQWRTLHNSAGQETRLRFSDGFVERRCSNGTSEILQYDSEGRLLGRLAYSRDKITRLTSFCVTYEYSAEGDLLRRDDSDRGSTHYEVDDAHRLIAEIRPRGERVGYAHDPADNVRLGSAFFGAGNRVLQWAGQRVQYDDRDRLAERGQEDGSLVRYRYDSFDLLTQIDTVDRANAPLSTWRAQYDAIGRRLTSGRAGATRQFYWDGDRLAAEQLPNGTLRIYDYATPQALVPLGFVDYDGPDAEPETGRTFHVFSEPSGMPLHVEDEQGTVVWRAERLDPFGTVSIQSGARIEYNLRWAGHYYDPETGLHYNRYRYYDPALGRYLQSDPTGYAGSPVNLYAYCKNPLVHVDLLGLHPDHVEGAAGAGEDAGEPDGREGTPRTAEELELTARRDRAASPGASRDQIAARMRLAHRFFLDEGQKYDRQLGANRPLTPSERRNEINCIDFDKPLVVGPPPPAPVTLNQWQPPGGNRGGYFAADGVPPEAVGAGPQGKAWNLPGQPVVDKVSTPYQIDPSTPYMQSTAAPAIDKWSVPGTPQPTPGQGTQYYIPEGTDSTSPLITRI